MKTGKKTMPSLSTCCVKMLGSAPKSMDDILDMCRSIGYAQFYGMVGIRATLGWHDELSGSRSIFVDTKPFDCKPGDKTYYSTHREGGKFGCIDQAFWVQAIMYFDGESVQVLSGKLDVKCKRTVGAVIEGALPCVS